MAEETIVAAVEEQKPETATKPNERRFSRNGSKNPRAKREGGKEKVSDGIDKKMVNEKVRAARSES